MDKSKRLHRSFNEDSGDSRKFKVTLQLSWEQFDMGRVIEQALAPIKAHFMMFFGWAILLLGVPRVLLGFAESWILAQPQTTFIIGKVGELFLYLILGTILQAVIARASIIHLGGGRPYFMECLTSGLRLILPLMGLSIVTFLGLMVGIALLIIPGIILFLMWSVAVPALIEERQGVFASLARSRDLTKGARWKILGGFLILVAIIIVITIAVAFFMYISGSLYSDSFNEDGLIFMLFSASLDTVSALIGATGAAAIYVELRAVKEGATPQSLTAIFE